MNRTEITEAVLRGKIVGRLRHNAKNFYEYPDWLDDLYELAVTNTQPAMRTARERALTHFVMEKEIKGLEDGYPFGKIEPDDVVGQAIIEAICCGCLLPIEAGDGEWITVDNRHYHYECRPPE